MVPITDPLDSDIKEARAEKDLVVKLGDVQRKKSDLLTLLGLSPTTQLHIKGKFSGDTKVSSFFEAASVALQERPDLKNIYLTEESARESVTLAQSSYWPTVSGSLSYEQSADNFSFKEASDNKSVTVSVSWNLWDSGGTYYGVRKARYNLQKSIYQAQSKREEVEKEVEAAWVKVFEEKKELEILEKILKTALENYKAYLIQFQEQEASAKNVLDAQDLLTSTVYSIIGALSSYHTAIAQLSLTMGKI